MCLILLLIISMIEERIALVSASCTCITCRKDILEIRTTKLLMYLKMTKHAITYLILAFLGIWRSTRVITKWRSSLVYATRFVEIYLCALWTPRIINGISFVLVSILASFWYYSVLHNSSQGYTQTLMPEENSALMCWWWLYNCQGKF